MLKKFDGPPHLPEEFLKHSRRPKKRSLRFLTLLLVFTAMIKPSETITVTCEAGFYLSSSVCIPCPSGKTCAAGVTAGTACTAGKYCPQGSKTETTCPAGFYCPASTALPIRCDLSAGNLCPAGSSTLPTLAAGSWSKSPKITPATTGCSTTNIISYQACKACPLGSTCPSGSANLACTGTGKYVSGTSCLSATAGNFAASSYFTQTVNPKYTFSAAGASTYSYCFAAQSCSFSTGGTATTACQTYQMAGLGAGICTAAPSGYYVSSNSFVPLAKGQYRAATSNTPVSCPVGKTCTNTVAATCPVMKSSTLGLGYCNRVKVGYYSSSGTETACATGQKYDKVTSTCSACPATSGTCDPFTGYTGSCQMGYYIPNQGLGLGFSCTICPAGQYCNDGVNKLAVTQTNSQQYPAKNTGNVDGKLPCPPGYSCSATTMTQLSPGFYNTGTTYPDTGTTNLNGNTYTGTSGNEQNYNCEQDLNPANSGGACPSDSYWESSFRLKCILSAFNVESKSTGSSSNDSNQICQGGCKIAWVGEPCTTQSVNNNWRSSAVPTDYYSGVHCPSGWNSWCTTAGTNPTTNRYCAKCSFWGIYSVTGVVTDATECVRGIYSRCRLGGIVKGNITNSLSTATHWHEIRTTNEVSLCQDCPPDLICVNNRYTTFVTYDFNYTPDDWTGWCVGKNPDISWYDANNGDLKIHMEDRRVSQYKNQVCFDCNGEEFTNGICSFASDYFPDHARTGTNPTYFNAIENNFLKAMILKCPFQSATRKQSRYLDSIAWQRLDKTYWTSYTKQIPSYSYTTYAFFDDTEDNIYPYSFCDRDEQYFDNTQITSHSEFPDSTEKANTECTLYEYFTPNFPMCEPNYSGFISDITHDRPTETAVPNGYYTQLTQNDDYTGIKLYDCPEFTEYLMSEGGVGAYGTCHIKDLGSCKDTTSDYCNAGQDYMCPDGYKKKTTGTMTNTINDCTSCQAPEVCSAYGTSTTICTDGYNCLAMTSDMFSKPGQPGEFLTANTVSLNNDISACASPNYCEGATYSLNVKVCPSGYYNSYATSGSGQHSLAGCTPVDAGNVGTNSVSCAAGKICPEGTDINATTADISIPPGFFSASTGIKSMNYVTVCPAGKFCGFASTTATTNCLAGYYCLEGTVLSKDTPCSFGQTSTAGSTSSTGCTSCTSGQFCQQGSIAPITVGTYCGTDNFLCIGGSLQRTQCPGGQYTTDGATCLACPAGKFCTAGVQPINCNAGYMSSSSLASCSLSTAGQIASGGATVAAAGVGLWSITGQKVGTACPSGYFCTGGVITGCANGQVCAQGSSATVSASSGTVQDEVNLFYQKLCPSGYICPTGVTRSLVVAGQYTKQGDSGAAASYCASGYSCAVGSIGSYNDACADGTYYLTNVASATCPTCASGSYCYQGQQILCEPGFYCDVTTPAQASFHQLCPVGTYATATGTSTVACTPCIGGYACLQRGGTTTPIYKCAKGFFCVLGATSTQPEQLSGQTADATYTLQCDPFTYNPTKINTLAALTGTDVVTCNQGVCPRGYYCPEGTDWPIVCPPGTYNLNLGEVDVSGCIQCIEGYYCPTPLIKTVCNAGTICPAGKDNQNSVILLFKPSVGHYSQIQYPDEIPCAAGTFQAATGSSSCTSCTAGSQCPITGMSVVQTCARGSDCSLAGVIIPKMCYYGQYLDPVNVVNPNCITCPTDSFCWNDGVIQADINAQNVLRNTFLTSGLCPNGYKCISGASIAGMNLIYSTNAAADPQFYSSNAYMCREGYYCNNAEVGVEIQCPIGTYMPRTGAQVVGDCLPCKSGYQCPVTATQVPTDCIAGFDCPEGTSTAFDQCQPGFYCPTRAQMQFQCNYGYYTTIVGQTTCIAAPLGSYINALQQTAYITCPIGYYCPLGSPIPIPCNMGTFTAVAGLGAATDCIDAPLSQYRISPTQFGLITDGYYSPNTAQRFAIPTHNGGSVCITGHYCVAGAQTLCAAGTICWKEMTTANVVSGVDECDPGFYCHAGSNRKRPTDIASMFGDICPKYNYCPISSVNPVNCPIGTYSDAIGLQAETECNKCKNGMYCPVAAIGQAGLLPCPAGSYCIESTSVASAAPLCGVGYYCPIVNGVGAKQQIPCPAGQYQDVVGQSSCKTCDLGNYCPFSYTTPGLKTQCPVGNVCPDINLFNPTPCSPGTFLNALGQSGSCQACTEGFYCPFEGMSVPVACPDQYFCPVSTTTPQLCADGYICDITIPTTQIVQTLCPEGFYCIQGKKFQCYAGYLCIAGAVMPNPIDGTTGKICDQGYWCSDSINQIACGTGNYQPYYGASEIGMCQTCPSGTTCPLAANSKYTYIVCPAGYICDTSGNTPCSQGYYCPQGTLVMLMCPPGTYQDLTASTSCKICIDYYYCEQDVTNHIGAIIPLACPTGHYCPEGTSNYQIYRCPIGTYHDTGLITKLKTPTECSPCPATFYCPVVGMTDLEMNDYPCQDGYICDAGSSQSIGTSECPNDHWCAAGTKTKCTLGTYSTATGLTSANECVACSPGKICINYSVGIVDCDEGYYCIGSVVTPTSANRIICPVGNYCPLGSPQPIKCLPGMFQDLTGQLTCKICPAGSYCPTSGLDAHIICAGDATFNNFWCPLGTITPRKCDIGLYVSADSITCESCPRSEYCWPTSDNTDGKRGICAYTEGYLCQGGSYSDKPLKSGLSYIQPGSLEFTTYNGPVLGGYISIATGYAQACPIGTFQPSILSQDCLDCYDGYFCPNTGMSDIADYRCAQGFYCLRGSTLEQPPDNTQYSVSSASPLFNQINGGLCPITKQCSFNLVHQMECADGYISQVQGLSLCNSCPNGFYCDIAENQVDPTLCISQSICTGGEKRQPICPIGTFMNVGQKFCQKCTAGNYCRAGIIAEQCAAGYVCATDGFNSVPDPAGTECSVGSYCPKGTLLEVLCPYKTMSMVSVGKQTTDCAACQPGWLCPVGQRNVTECPTGHYCPPQGDDVVYPEELYACALGTYNPLTKQVYQANCLDCDVGFYCNITGLANITGRNCPKGYFCPKGTIQPIPCRGGTYQNSLGAQDEDFCDSCPVGTYCLQASIIPTPCEEGFSCPYMSSIMLACTGGFYCNKETRFQESECPVNSYCPRGSAYPIPCDKKHTCPAQTEEQIFCVNGNYVDTKPSQYGMQNVCKKCRPGTYSIADTDGCLPCPAGFLCYGGTNSDYPKSISYNRGEICPKGYYCPEGSYEEEPCPPGTFNAEFGAKSLNQCNLCIPGSSNAFYGQEGCNPCGQFANSYEGATRCTCNGAGRVYSPVDNSCRCKTGYDFKSVDGVSLGQSSDNTDCIPLVLDRCDQAGQVRDPSGACVQMNDCKKECKGLSGKRDAILGICQCDNYPATVDEICNQACRAAAPKISFDGNDTTKIFMLINNKSTPLDLTQVGDVYGRPSTGTGAVKTVTMGGDGGFVGSYSAPSLIQNALSGVPNITNNSQKTNQTQQKPRKLSRDLQDTSPLLSDQIQNPSYCISIGDTFIFTIGNAAHYPVYMKDSVLNTNSQFDYGSFIELASEMVRKTAQEITTTSFFSFTFNQKGSYIFQDAADSSQLMQITVKGLGEKCQDPDRFLQVMSGNSLSANGIAQRLDLIINPNYPLIVSMTLLLFFGTGFTMWMVSYCMRKGWTIHDMQHDNYREIQLSVNIHHENEKLFIENNDFVNHKSELIDHEEDDLEMVNMDIQIDLIEAGQKYLHKWDKRKQKYKRAKVHKKKEIQMLLSEVESLVAILNSDSTAAQMHWLDLDVLQDGSQIDDKQIKFQIEKQMNAINKQEDTQNENYKAKQEELLNAASERERLLHEQARENMLKNQSDVCKQINITDEVITDIKAASEYAIYDNGDIKTKNNQHVKKVEENQILNDEEKERLLNNHESALHNIDSLLEIEKRKQEHELDRALKERLDRRHRIKEKLHSQDIKKDHLEIEKEISVVYDQKKHEAIERFNRMHEEQIKDIITNSDLAIQRQQIQSLEELTDQKKRQSAIDLEQEQLKEIEAKKQIVQKKYLDGHANEEDLANELRRIMGDQASNFDQLSNQANKERSDQEAKLKIQLAQRQKKILDDSNKEADKAVAEVDKEDLIQAHERQVVATDAHLRLKAKAQDGNDGTLGCLGLDKQGLPITNAKIVQAADVARKEEQERKTEMIEMKFRIDQNIDTTLQQQSLLTELEESNSNLAILMKQQEDLQLAKLNARKEQLKARRLTKIKIEKDEKVVRAKIESEEFKQNENRKISEQYVRTIFKNVPKNETLQAKEKRLELLNEFMSDQFLEELTALLSKQYMENDALLKLNMHKYLTEGLNEANAVQNHFKIDTESLNRLQPHMDESDYNTQMKKLKLNEANLLKKTNLAVMKGHAEEEARLRKELDKKHMQEQIELRQSLSQRQAALRIQLVGETQLGEQESELDRKALEKFQQQKSTEQERRMRAIELQKKTLQNQVDTDMKQIYEDYDDMKRKQKKAEQEAILNEDTLKKRIQERKDKIKKSYVKQGLTQEEQDALLKNYQEQLAQLDSAYATEQRRQQLIMKTKQDNRKKRLIKVQQLKQELDKKETPLAAQKVEGSLARALRNKMFKLLDDSARREDDSELYRRLKDWNLHKRDYEYQRLTKKAAEAGLVELDERQIQIMVIKLQQIEKLLKEVGRQRKLKLKSKAEKPEKAKMSQSLSSKPTIKKPANAENKKLVETIAENFEDEDDANLISKPSTQQGNFKTFVSSSQKDRQQNSKLTGEQNKKLGTKKF